MPPTISKATEWISAFQSRAPVDVKQIAERLGLQIYELDDMPPGASGKLYPDPNSRAGFSIGVNKADSYTRKRFTIAHEIAHFILHRNDVAHGVLDDTLYRSEHLSGAQETEANKFAADILMPLPLLRSIAQHLRSVEELAKLFGVSTQAMSIRLGIPLP